MVVASTLEHTGLLSSEVYLPSEVEWDTRSLKHGNYDTECMISVHYLLRSIALLDVELTWDVVPQMERRD